MLRPVCRIERYQMNNKVAQINGLYVGIYLVKLKKQIVEPLTGIRSRPTSPITLLRNTLIVTKFSTADV
jgi:hypothetical protein